MGVNCEGWTLYSKEQKYIDAFECGVIEGTEGSYKNLMDTTQDEWMDASRIWSRKRTVGLGEIIETGLLWTHDTKIRKSGKKN